MKRATTYIEHTTHEDGISIHALVKRATFCQNMATQHAIDFNPRPREEGDLSPFGAEGDDKMISIHALVKRATTLTVIGAAIADISIHALVKRATAYIGCNADGIVISIHALVKRATL